MSETDYGLFALIAPKQFIPTIMARTKHTLKPINDVITDFCVFMSVQVVDEIFGVVALISLFSMWMLLKPSSAEARDAQVTQV
jgi:hypothetical protein